MKNSQGASQNALRPEYIPLEPFLEEQIVWCPPAKSSEDTTLFLITRTGSEEPKILKLQNGQVTPLTVKELPFESSIAPKKKSLLSLLRPTSILAGVGYLVAVFLLAFVVSVNVGYMQARVVLTDSMSGTFEPGDVVIAAPWIEPAVDDIAIYQARDFQGEVRAEFVHRIVSGNVEAGFEFKGDNNAQKDALVVLTDDIRGVVLFWIPNAGSIMTPQNLLMGFGVVMFLYFGIGYIRDELMERKLRRKLRRQGK
jgi:signal peptidase I